VSPNALTDYSPGHVPALDVARPLALSLGSLEEINSVPAPLGGGAGHGPRLMPTMHHHGPPGSIGLWSGCGLPLGDVHADLRIMRVIFVTPVSGVVPGRAKRRATQPSSDNLRPVGTNGPISAG
jgi:hypothetical protein